MTIEYIYGLDWMNWKTWIESFSVEFTLKYKEDSKEHFNCKLLGNLLKKKVQNSDLDKDSRRIIKSTVVDLSIIF